MSENSRDRETSGLKKVAVQGADVPATCASEHMCCAVSASGRFGEPLACGHRKGHDGEHSWASLPTFVNGVAQPPEGAVAALEAIIVAEYNAGRRP